MKNFIKRSISMLVATALCLQIVLPSITVTSYATSDEVETYTISNGNIQVVVSAENGGFVVKTVEGNSLKKDDNNKDLLYHSGDYDTSFTSFRVTRSGETKDYLFGGDYGFLGLNSSDVTVNQTADTITAVWEVDGIQFTQNLALADTSSNEHGMVSITYEAYVKDGSDAEIEARVLFDTALGTLDYGYYSVENAANATVTDSINKEKIILATDYTTGILPSTLYACDDTNFPSIMAYTVNSASSQPYQIAFGHWNNLASTLFDFAPDDTMTFTSQNNIEYLTADSAYAIYFDMGKVDTGNTAAIYTSYGVYSNANIAAEDSIAINLVTPKTLELNEDKTEYISLDGALGDATFSFDVNIENIASTTASSVAVAVYTQTGMTAMDVNGEDLAVAPTYLDPHYITFYNLESGKTNDTTFQIKADVASSATYRKIEVCAFDTSSTTALSQENIIGVNSFYVLCPGGDGELPVVTFTGADPTVLYYEGSNHYIVKGNNFGLLENKADYELYFQNVNDPNDYYIIDDDSFFIDSANGTIDIITQRSDGSTWPLKTYQLYINWGQGTTQAQNGESVYTAESLSVTFSSSEYYKSSTYGLIIVYQDTSSENNEKYYIKELIDEAAYEAFLKTDVYSEVLLVFRGNFVKNPTSSGGGSLNNVYQKDVYIATSLSSDEVITINDCLDLENGTVTVYYEDESVLVDFNGDLYTSDAKTGVWTGKASLTEITNGKEYSLIQYGVDGTRQTDGNVISLVWPLGASIGQSLAGMLFELGYGELGVIEENGKEVGRVVAFTASIDLSFIIPNGSKVQGNKTDSAFARVKDAFNFGDNDYSNADLRTRAAVLVTDAELTDEEKAKQAAGDGTLAVTVNDVLFGCGTGFYGLNFDVDVVIPSYTENMPKISCKLAVNTINNWSFGLDGSIVFSDFSMGATIEIISYNDIPIPNSLFIYVKSSPGINVDGTGALWITGGGGGFDNLYDCIINADTLPTLQLLLRLYFEIYQVVEGQADSVFSLQGFTNTLTNLKLKGTTTTIIPKATVSVQWLPDFYYKSSITVSMFEIITGGGYIVVEVPYDNPEDTFAEGYVFANVSIPKKYGILGGITVGGAELGINVNKVWGNLTLASFLNVGMIYYWGDEDSFDFGLDVENASPTYPELLGYEEPVLLGYDEESGEPIYMELFTNFSVSAQAEIVDDLSSAVALFSTEPYIRSNTSRTEHEIYLGEYQGKSDVFTLVFTAESEENAREIVDNFSITRNGQNFALSLYGDVDVNDMNANLTYDEDTGKANLAIFTRDANDYDVIWKINTNVVTDIVAYDVAEVAALNSLDASIIANEVTVNWDGTKLNNLDSIAFYLTKDATVSDIANPEDILLATVTSSTVIATDKTYKFNISPELASGDYYVRAVYNQEGISYGTQTTASTIKFDNLNMPSEIVSITSVENAGDSCFNVTLSPLSSATGYVVNILNSDGSTSEIYDLKYDSTGDSITVKVGGSYEMPVYDTVLGADGNYQYTDTGATQIAGLLYGESYIIEAMAYNDVDIDGDGIADYIVYGAVDTFAAISLNKPTESEAIVTANTSFKNITYTSNSGDNPVYPTFSENSLSLSVKTDTGETISGKWALDTAYENDTVGNWGEFTGESVLNINLSDIEEGTHQLKIWGTDETGDSYNTNYVFVIDTLAPNLMISAPLDGGVYSEDGSVDFTGIVSREALLTLVVEGKTIFTSKTIDEVSNVTYNESTGAFTFPVSVDKTKSSQSITLTASDALGHSTDYTVSLSNAGLGNIASIEIYADDSAVSESNINENGNVITQLSLMAVTKNDNVIEINDAQLVNWTLTTVEGDATITPSGLLSIDEESEGFVQGAYMVSSLAAMTTAVSFTVEEEVSTSTSSSSSSASSLVKTVTEGKLAEITLPNDYESVTYMVYYYNDDKEAVPVMLSAVTDNGTIKFIAPVTAKYYVQVAEVTEFTDLASDHYAKEYIDFCVLRGLFNGTGNSLFEANASTTRAMFVTLLWRLAGEPIVEGDLFDDVAEGMWYTEAVRFASANGIVNGYSDSIFGTNDPITREQMCAIIIRYADYFGHSLSSVNDVTFIDSADVSAYAVEYVDLCAEYGLVVGYETGAFNPKNNSTRGQIAIVLNRYIKSVLEEWDK